MHLSTTSIHIFQILDIHKKHNMIGYDSIFFSIEHVQAQT